MLLILLIILLVGLPFGGSYYNDGAYRGYGFGIGGILLLVVLFLLFSGHRVL